MKRAQALASLQAYLPEDKEIIKIINLCDLYPMDESSSGWRGWCNQYSPYIRVQKNKKLVTKWKGQDCFASQNDLYAYASTQEVAKFSKKLLFLVDKNCFCLLFWGQDDRFRYRRYFDGTYWNDPPLFLPINDLRTFIKLEKVESFEKIQTTKKSSTTQAWITSWPPKKEFYQEIKGIACNPVESLILENVIAENNTKMISLR